MSLPMPWDTAYLNHWFGFLQLLSDRYGKSPAFKVIAADGPTSVTMAYSAFTHVAACTLALPPYFVTCISRRLQPFRYLHSCSGSFRLEHLPGGTRTHWKTPPFHGARPKPPVTLLKSGVSHAGKRTVASGPPHVYVGRRRAHDI